MNFKEKVRSLSAKEIILAMVEGLQNPTATVDMSSYGKIKHGICYGCAALNTICKIGDYTTDHLKANTLFQPYQNRVTILRESLTTTNMSFIGHFEDSIEYLRLGNVRYYNSYANKCATSRIVDDPRFDLPILFDDYTAEDLQAYRDLADRQV
jgi:hypothetical protein